MIPSRINIPIISLSVGGTGIYATILSLFYSPLFFSYEFDRIKSKGGEIVKPKKSKKQRLNVHVDFSFTDEACHALANALAFLQNLDGFSFDTEKISEESSIRAEEKLSACEKSLSRGEIRAVSKAIDVVLEQLPGNRSRFSYIEEDLPDLLADLERDMDLLRHWQIVFHEVVKDLKKM